MKPTYDFEVFLATQLVANGFAEERPGYGHATGDDIAEWLVAQTWFQHIVGAAQDAVNAGVVTFDLDPSTDTLLY